MGKKFKKFKQKFKNNLNSLFRSRSVNLFTTHNGDQIPLYDNSTITAIQSGDWNNTATWGGSIPGPNDVVLIPNGTSVELSGNATVLDALVQGSLILKENHSLKIRTLIINDGYLYQDPGEIVIRDLPIADFDPEFFGNGVLLLNGNWETREFYNKHHLKYTPYTYKRDLSAGSVVLFGSYGDLRGVKVGDRFVVPDTRQPVSHVDFREDNHTEIVTVTEVDRYIKTTPLQYDHPMYVNRLGYTERVPSIGGLDICDITIRSENPNGVRGHVLIASHSTCNISGVHFKELGRTTVEPLDSTVLDKNRNVVHSGTNQIARYALHFHHCLGPMRDYTVEEHEVFDVERQFKVEKCVIEGSPKWGVVIHHSHYGQVKDCFIYDCAGAHLVTEGTDEYANILTGNLIIGHREGSNQTKTPQGGTRSSITARAHRNLRGGDHWHNKVGLGLASAMNDFSNTEIYGCFDAIGMAGFGTSSLLRHRPKPGSTETGRHMYIYDGGDRRRIYPFLGPSENVLVWGCLRGFEAWTANSYKEREDHVMFPGLTLIHCRTPTDFEDQTETYFKGWKILGDWSNNIGLYNRPGTTAVFFKHAYRFGITFDDCEFRGYDCAYELVIDRNYLIFNRCTFECIMANYVIMGWHFSGGEAGLNAEWNNCEFLPTVQRFIDGAGVRFSANRSNIRLLNKLTIGIYPWRNGHDMMVYFSPQHIDFSLEDYKYYSPDATTYNDLPEGVITQRELKELGIPILGRVVPEWGYKSEEFSHFYVAEVKEPSGFRYLKNIQG